MAYSNNELADEFWMLTKGILQDGTVDTQEAKVIYHWLNEHCPGDWFKVVTDRLAKFLEDGYIDRFESKSLIDAFGTILRTLRAQSA